MHAYARLCEIAIVAVRRPELRHLLHLNRLQLGRAEVEASRVFVAPERVIVPDTEALLEAGRLEGADHVALAPLPGARGDAVVVLAAVRELGGRGPRDEPAAVLCNQHCLPNACVRV